MILEQAGDRFALAGIQAERVERFDRGARIENTNDDFFAELGRQTGRIGTPGSRAVDFEKERALRLLSLTPGR